MFKIENTQKGVKAFLGGFSAIKLQSKIDDCKDGKCSCSCDSSVMRKITNIEVKEENGGASITINGDVNAKQLEPMMKGCLL